MSVNTPRSVQTHGDEADRARALSATRSNEPSFFEPSRPIFSTRGDNNSRRSPTQRGEGGEAKGKGSVHRYRGRFSTIFIEITKRSKRIKFLLFICSIGSARYVRSNGLGALQRKTRGSKESYRREKSDTQTEKSANATRRFGRFLIGKSVCVPSMCERFLEGWTRLNGRGVGCTTLIRLTLRRCCCLPFGVVFAGKHFARQA